MIGKIRSTFLPLCAAVLTMHGAHAAPLGNGADAAELDMLGTPRAYADPYGTPMNGKGGQRGPVTGVRTVDGTSPTDKLLAQQGGNDQIVAARGGRVLLKPLAKNRDPKMAQTPDGAAAALYQQQPVGGKVVGAAKPKEIYKSPW